MTGLRGAVDLWSVVLGESANEAAAVTLTEEERAWARRGRGPVARHRMLRRAALRCVLAQYGSGPAAAVSLTTDAAGRPRAHGAGLPAELRFSATSNGGRCMVAVTAAGLIGVDLERLCPVPEAASVAHRHLGAAVAARVARLDGAARDRAFLEAWTRLEAYVKATGHGLARALDRGAPMEMTDGVARGWHLLTFPVADEHVASVAVRVGPGAPPPALRWRRAEDADVVGDRARAREIPCAQAMEGCSWIGGAW
jgi:4'-phosphopantetheinyl transferase